jgi:hypothetical protein
MSKRRSKKRKGGPTAPGDGRAYYVYCIGERDALAPLFEVGLPGGIEEGAPVEMVEADDLAAVASAVPADEYGAERLQARLADPAWTAVRAMRHEKIMEHFAARSTIIPLRFATIYLSRDRIGEMISERRAELLEIIERLRGREEWGINIYCDRASLMSEITSISPRLCEMAERAEKSSPGQAYLLRRQIEALKSDEARAETKRVIAEVESRLAAASEQASRLRVIKGEAGEAGETVAKLAYLVSRERFDLFREAAEALAREHGTRFRLEMTGPWPAYAFSSPGEAE